MTQGTPACASGQGTRRVLLAVQRGVLPPTANYEVPDPECDLDYVPKVAREQKVDVAVSVGSGFGGFQSAIVLAAPTRRTE